MSILRSDDGKELIVTCHFGCDEGIHIRIERDHFEGIDPKRDYFAFVNCLNNNFYTEQETAWSRLKLKMKKIWAILRNKDYYYSDVVMTYDEAKMFRGYIKEMIPDD